MARKKPLEVGKPVALEPEGRAHPYLQLAVAALAIIVFFILFTQIYPILASRDGGQQGEIAVLLQPERILEGEGATAKAFSSCGSFALYLDGSKISEGESKAEAAISPAAGGHLLEAKNEKCSSSLPFSVLKKECAEGQVKECGEGNCTGNQTCRRGLWGGCELQRKVCVPGQKIGCGLDGCHFGYAACNDCGNAFGPCLPVENANGPLTANSASCP